MSTPSSMLMYVGSTPQPSKSHHQDCYMFWKESLLINLTLLLPRCTLQQSICSKLETCKNSHSKNTQDDLLETTLVEVPGVQISTGIHGWVTIASMDGISTNTYTWILFLVCNRNFFQGFLHAFGTRGSYVWMISLQIRIPYRQNRPALLATALIHVALLPAEIYIVSLKQCHIFLYCTNVAYSAYCQSWIQTLTHIITYIRGSIRNNNIQNTFFFFEKWMRYKETFF